jgi:arylsulfatase
MNRRNIVVFLCDQLRPDFLSIYGCKGVPTPNLDRLAREGIVFDRAITVSTVCAPARASMMTGRYVSDHQVWTNDVPFRDGMEYLAERMNEAGYRTGAFGKLHHYPALDAKGFEVFAPMEENRLGEDSPYYQWLKERYPDAQGDFNLDGLNFRYSEKDYYEQWIADRALDFIGSSKDKPFLAWISFQGPHGPFDPPKEVSGSCDASQLPSVLCRNPDETISSVVQTRSATVQLPEGSDWELLRVKYAEMIVAIDRQIGRVLQNLEQRGLYENTTFIFSADHGDMLGDYQLNMKGPFPYRGQLDIPLIVANDPAIKPGTRTQALCGNLDIPGTCLDLAGDDKPLGHSRSLLDLAQSEPKHPRTVNFHEFCDSIKTVEEERYRFCYYPFTTDCELFDLASDPDETRNLAELPDYAAVCQRMMQHLLDFQILAKGVRIEAHDLVHEQQQGLDEKHPVWRKELPICFPLSTAELERLKAAGLPSDINEFCRTKDVMRHYALPYWQEKSG